MNEITLHQVDEKTVMDYLFSSGTKLTESQKRLFINLAIKNNLDPFKREIYALPFGQEMSVVTGYEVYLKRAEASKMLDGWKCWTEGTGDLMKAIVEIKRKDWSTPFTHEVFMSEYTTRKSLWNTKPITMLKKVAIAQAFRLAFPAELGGMIYTSDEMQDVTPSEQIRELAPATTESKPVISQGLSKYVHIFFKNAGFEEDDKIDLLYHYFGVDDTTKITREGWLSFNHEIEKLLNRTLTKKDPAISEVEFGVIGDYLLQVLETLNVEDKTKDDVNVVVEGGN
ncbi:phage recombination protein Bet [bacterium]|nr:phage recombination protein Bet [bacterium]